MMSESKKSTEGNKSPPAPQPKPAAPAPSERNLRTGYTFVADTAENIRRKDK